MHASRRLGSNTLALIAIVCAGLNLRAAIVAIAPVVSVVRVDLGVSSALMGLLTAIPLVCFAVISPFVPGWSRRWGMERLVLIALALIAAFSALRLIETFAAQVVATLGIGIAIAVGNVGVPAVIKRWFPGLLGIATGLFSVSLFLGAAFAGSFTYPLFSYFHRSWGVALAIWGLFAALALAVWIAFARDPSRGSSLQTSASADTLMFRYIWTSPLAWLVTSYMGLQSLHYYTVTAWLPEILMSSGYSAAVSGVVLGVSNVCAIVMAIIVPVVAHRIRSQAGIGLILVLLSALGLLVLDASEPFLPAALLGAGQGGAIGLALLLVLLRVETAAQAAVLAGMSQSVGYLLAAAGPPVIGLIYDRSGGWTLPLGILLCALVAQAAVVFFAGRPNTIVPLTR